MLNSNPFRLNQLKKIVNHTKTILDVGCGNFSPQKTKKVFPKCIYHGLDIEYYNLDNVDKKSIDKFFKLDLEKNDLKDLKDNFYDIIIFSHVIEHLLNGELVLKRLLRKLKKGGVIYIEMPSDKSLLLPSGKNTLNFFDDPTHVRFYSLSSIINILLERNNTIIKCKIKRDLRHILLFPFYILLQLVSLLKERRLDAKGLWDITGFANYIIAQKR